PMNDEELLKAVGRSARSAEPLDERWDRLAADALSEEERARLLEAAAQSEEAAEAYEAFRPLGAEFEARVVHRLLGGRSGAAAPASSTTGAPGRVIEFPRHKPRFAWVSLALAASLLVAVGVVTLMRPGTVPSLPGYGLRLEGQVA